LKEYKSATPVPPPKDHTTQTSAKTDQPPPPKKEETPPPPQPRPSVTIPAGTEVTIRLINPVDSSRNHVGQKFDASIDVPVLSGNRTVIPAGANAKVLLAGVNQAGHIKGRSDVQLELVSVTIHGTPYPVKTSVFEQQGSSRGKRSAAIIGGGAAVGAAIGGVFGHKKGAAVGAASGPRPPPVSKWRLTPKPSLFLPRRESLLRYALRSRRISKL